MKHISTWTVCVAVSLFTAAVFAKAPSGRISATLFDGRGNKEVLAEATHAQREVTPAPRPSAVSLCSAVPAQQQPQATTSTITDGKGGAVRTIEQKGDTTTVKDGKGRVVSSTTKNADGSTTMRDGTGRVRGTSNAVPAK